MTKIYNYLLILLFTSFVISSCKVDDRDILNTTGDVDIHSFTINGVKGTINPENSTITVIMPSGTDLKNLSPQIKIAEGATISPNNAVVQSFADAYGNLIHVTYLVTNKDLYQKYKVTVDVARAKITKFKIGSTEADIDDLSKKITIYLPLNTDVTNLIPVVDYTEGATLTPAPGNVVNFSNPVTYQLEYLGSTFTYEVQVILGSKPKPILIIYNGENVSPVWGSIASTISNGAINPKTDGLNSTSTCISIMRKKEETDDGGRPWSGGALWNATKVNIDPAIYKKFTLMVLKETAGDVQLELQSDGEQNKDWLKAYYSENALGKWQELTFEIPANRTAIINSILVAPHVIDTKNDPNFTTHIVYWDELKAYPK